MKERVESDNYEEDDFSFYNINSITIFLKNNVIQICLFIMVFIIIYIVDHISNINTMLLAIQQQQIALQNEKNMKKYKSKKLKK